MAGKNGYWKKHPKKEIQLFLYELHLSGWRIENPPRYYTALRPFPKKHRASIHLTPSGRYSLNNTRRHLENNTCFTRPGRGSDVSDSDAFDL